jgi:hypothetical protein
MHWIEDAPLWLILPSFALALVLAHEIGYRTRRLIDARRAARGTVPAADTEDGIGYLLSAALALLALLIAFTFSMAAQRFDARRLLLVDEANAVGTVYLRYQLLDEPDRSKLSDLLVSYLDARSRFFAADSEEALAAPDARSDDIEARIWTLLSADLRTHPQATINPSLLQATNEMFDLASSDRAARTARVPVTILRALGLYAVIAALILGHSLASGRNRHFISATALFVLLSLAFTLILDLDRPTKGTIQISSAHFDRAAAGIRAAEKSKAQATP